MAWPSLNPGLAFVLALVMVWIMTLTPSFVMSFISVFILGNEWDISKMRKNYRNQ